MNNNKFLKLRADISEICEVLRLKSMKLHNFMGLEGEVYLEFDSEKNEIIGKNGAGKSTILNALAFVFCYTDAFGNGNNKVSFSYANKLGTETWVELICRMDGVDTVVKRNFSYTTTGKQVSSLWINHSEIKSTEWKNCIDKDVFLSLINPKYFSGLDEKAAKKLLTKFVSMKNISEADVLTRIEDDDVMTFLAEEIDENDIETLKEHYEAEIKALSDKKKENRANIKILKATEKAEMPEDKFVIDGIVMTETAAWEYVINLAKDSMSDDNVTRLKLFMELKAKRARELEAASVYNSAMSTIATLEAENETIDDEVAEMKKKMGYVDMYYEAMLEELNINSLPDIKILFKDALDAPCFQIQYKGVPIQECSFAEQVKAGIIISDYLMYALDINYPIFIDNAECITNMPDVIEPRQFVSFTVENCELSRYNDDEIENIETLETMPRNRLKKRTRVRLLCTDFSCGDASEVISE